MQNKKGCSIHFGPKGGKYYVKNGKKIYFGSKSKMMNSCPSGKILRTTTGRCVKEATRKHVRAAALILNEVNENENRRALEMLRRNILPGLRQGKIKNYF